MSSIADTNRRLARLDEAVRSGATVTNEDTAFLCDLLGDIHKTRQRAAAECLAELARQEPHRGAVLQDQLESVDSRVRWGAAYALSLLDEFPPAAIDTAIDLLGTTDRDLRWAAANLIKRAVGCAESAVLKRLCDAARQGSVVQRRMALYALRDVAGGDVAARGAAQDALAEADVELRLAGLAAFVQLSAEPSAAAERIVGLLEDAEVRIQRAAAAALGSLGCRSKNVMQAIERALASPDHSVRRAAKKSLDRLATRGDAPSSRT